MPATSSLIDWNKLVSRGVLEKVAYEERPPRFEYRLTDKGRELLPVVLVMMRWDDRWESGKAPTTLTHTACGHTTEALVVCSQCRELLELGQLRAHPITVRLPKHATPVLSNSV